MPFAEKLLMNDCSGIIYYCYMYELFLNIFLTLILSKTINWLFSERAFQSALHWKHCKKFFRVFLIDLMFSKVFSILQKMIIKCIDTKLTVWIDTPKVLYYLHRRYEKLQLHSINSRIFSNGSKAIINSC